MSKREGRKDEREVQVSNLESEPVSIETRIAQSIWKAKCCLQKQKKKKE